jgi:hypothetical protein
MKIRLGVYHETLEQCGNKERLGKTMYYVAEYTICILVLPVVTKIRKVRRVLIFFITLFN